MPAVTPSGVGRDETWTDGAANEIPTGTLNSEDLDKAKKQGGCLIVYYVTKANATFNPSMTIGGQSATSTTTATADLTTDNHMAVFVFDAAAIRAMTNYTVSTSGDWADAGSDHTWGYGVFAMVDDSDITVTVT